MILGYYLLPVAVIFSLFSLTSGHGRLIEPPSRASAWRYGFNTPQNYNDHELFCGGFTRQWVKNEGKCGVCGDPWDSKVPRAHDFGGTYGKGIIVRKYQPSSVITIRVEITASHWGYFEFSICPNYKTPTQECLDQNILQIVKPQENVEHKGFRYFPKDGNKVYEMKYKLPKKACEHCLLQWRYIAGNNWGLCPNNTGAVGCGPQEEFRACADIAISGKADQPSIPEVEEPPTTPSILSSTILVPTIPTPQESYSPISALFISFVSFLVAFSILFLLYFHFYHLGRHVKSWIKGPKEKGILESPPLPPPRTRRRSPSRRFSSDGMHEVDLKDESLA